jgi:cytochrome c peroxidase
LEAVITHYVSGGEKRPSLAKEMKPLNLSAQDVQDLLAFMNSLSSPQTTLAMPNLPSH